MRGLFLIIAIVASLFSSELSWSKNFLTSKSEATKNDKLILLVYTMKDCAACEYLKDVTLDNDEVKEYINKNFVIVERDAKNPSHKVSGLDVFGSPTIYFLNKNGEKVAQPTVGALTATKFLDKLKEVAKSSQK